MIDPLLSLPPHVRERLAAALDSGLLPATPSAGPLRSVLGNVESMGQVAAALAGLDHLDVSAAAAALWIRSVSKLEVRSPRVDLVWSGPEVPGLHARDTKRVYEELLGSADRSLWVSTYVFFDGPRAFGTLARRIDTVPELRVMLLLNIQRRRGDTTVAEELVRRFAERSWTVESPGKLRAAVFYDPRAFEPDEPSGVLHARAVVSDDESVFVTSANLTEAAWERNIELRLLVRDCVLAASITAHFRGVIDRGLLLPLPAA